MGEVPGLEAGDEELDEIVEALVLVLRIDERRGRLEGHEAVDRAPYDSGTVDGAVAFHAEPLEDPGHDAYDLGLRFGGSLDGRAGREQRARVLAGVFAGEAPVGMGDLPEGGGPRPTDGGVAEELGEILAGPGRQDLPETVDPVDVVVEGRGAHAEVVGDPSEGQFSEAALVDEAGGRVDDVGQIDPLLCHAPNLARESCRVHSGMNILHRSMSSVQSSLVFVIAGVLAATAASAVIHRVLRFVFTRGALRQLQGLPTSSRWRVRVARTEGESSAAGEIRRRQRIDAVALAFSRLAAAVVWGSLFVVVLHSQGISVGAAVSGAGFVGVVLALGGQASVNDFMSGLHILLEDRFGEGDEIALITANGKEVRGVVTALGMFGTRIESGGRVHHIANRHMSEVTNYSQRPVSVFA